jgi:hypothetical protein
MKSIRLIKGEFRQSADLPLAPGIKATGLDEISLTHVMGKAY